MVEERTLAGAGVTLIGPRLSPPRYVAAADSPGQRRGGRHHDGDADRQRQTRVGAHLIKQRAGGSSTHGLPARRRMASARAAGMAAPRNDWND